MAGLLAALLLGGCLGAKTLGHEPADHIVITGTPTWSNGVARLMDVKCAVCHQAPRPETAPTNLPPDVDLRLQTAAGALRGAEDIAAQIVLHVLRQPVSYGESNFGAATITIRAMPLSYATPLYADEIAALETWAGGVISAESAFTSPVLSHLTPPYTVADGAVLYTRFCQSCHGINGGGGRVQNSIQGLIYGPDIAAQIKSVSVMFAWPVLTNLATACTVSAGYPANCSSTQLDAIALFLSQF